MRHDLLVNVAKLYYEQHLSQLQISRKLGVSRSSVSNLLKQCRAQGIVEIRINDSSTHAQRMQRELCARFGLAHAIVLPSDPDPEQAKVHVGRAAAGLVDPLLRDGVRIGISWGTTLYQLVRHITPAALNGVEVIQLHGGLGAGNPDIDGFGLAQKLAEKLRGSYRIMQAPIIVGSVELRRMLQQEPGISAALKSGAGADIALFGIGSNIPGISSLVRAGYLSERESLALLSAGAVATVCGLQIGADGAVVPSDLNDRLVGIDRETLVRIPVRVGAAAGARKAEAVLAAIRGSFVTALVVDEAIASRVLSSRPLSVEDLGVQPGIGKSFVDDPGDVPDHLPSAAEIEIIAARRRCSRTTRSPCRETHRPARRRLRTSTARSAPPRPRDLPAVELRAVPHAVKEREARQVPRGPSREKGRCLFPLPRELAGRGEPPEDEQAAGAAEVTGGCPPGRAASHGRDRAPGSPGAGRSCSRGAPGAEAME